MFNNLVFEDDVYQISTSKQLPDFQHAINIADISSSAIKNAIENVDNNSVKDSYKNAYKEKLQEIINTI